MKKGFRQLNLTLGSTGKLFSIYVTEKRYTDILEKAMFNSLNAYMKGLIIEQIKVKLNTPCGDWQDTINCRLVEAIQENFQTWEPDGIKYRRKSYTNFFNHLFDLERIGE